MPTKASRPLYPHELRRHSVWSIGLFLGFFLRASIQRFVLPLVLVVVAAAVVQLYYGSMLLLNRNRLAERLAEWRRSRKLFIGGGSASVPVNRLSGTGTIGIGGVLTFVAATLIVDNWNRLI